jgi:hypothetical protein
MYPEGKGGDSPSQLIDARIKELSDWRGETLARVRILIKQADPEVVEEWKWRGVPVWAHAGIICTGETYNNVVKMTFAKGASMGDPSGLFNSSLEGNTRRAIDFHEGRKRMPDTKIRAGSQEICSVNAGKEPTLINIAAAIATSVGPIRPAIIFEVVMLGPFHHIDHCLASLSPPNFADIQTKMSISGVSFMATRRQGDAKSPCLFFLLSQMVSPVSHETYPPDLPRVRPCDSLPADR